MLNIPLNDRIRAQQEKAEKAEAENKKRLLSLQEQLIPELRNNDDAHGSSVSNENKIEIMYGNEDSKSIVTTEETNNGNKTSGDASKTAPAAQAK